MGNVKVSVIVPVFQGEAYLERCIDSILNQTLKDIEIIIVNDGSEDKTPIICDEYAAKYNFIKVIHKKNDGLGMARNSGIEISCGEYLSFVDSDDVIEANMLEEMYEVAIRNKYDIVMCDVHIIYVDTDKEIIVKSWENESVSLSDYIAFGENITYSVNKIYRKDIFDKYRFSKMLFEDIAIIPVIVSNYVNLGYVSEPYYKYLRRSNTLSTTMRPELNDIVKAFRMCIINSNILYRDSVVYCVARQILWNLTTERKIFKSDFIDLIVEFKELFEFNQYIRNDKNVFKILDLLNEKVIPKNVICTKKALTDKNEIVNKNIFSSYSLLFVEEYENSINMPEIVKEAYNKKNMEFVNDYISLKLLYENGGFVIGDNMIFSIMIHQLRENELFWGFESKESILKTCFGAVEKNVFILKLLNTYEEDNIYNKMFLSFEERVRDLLIVFFDMKDNGREQNLQQGIKIYAPNVLVYDMKDGKNCCKKYIYNDIENHELISFDMLEIWNEKILNNWKLYKNAQFLNGDIKQKSNLSIKIKELENQINCLQNVVNAYEEATLWKLTKPIRLFIDFFKKNKK